MSAPAVHARLSVDRPFSVSVVEVAGALGTGDDGLSPAEAADRLALVGPNLLPEPKRTPAWLRFLSHFNDTLTYILLGAAGSQFLITDQQVACALRDVDADGIAIADQADGAAGRRFR